MDSTPIMGRYRPVEQDAVRVLTVVHQLGEQPADPRRWFIDTEGQLQQLDHLVRHPIDLAYVLIDQVRSRGVELEARLSDLARRMRQLLGATRRGRHRPSLLRPFDPGSWRRWDDMLALLGCRGLMRIEPLTDAQTTGELRYRLTDRGARWLGDSLPLQGALEDCRERCRLLRVVLPACLLRPRSHGALGRYLRDTAQDLDAYRGDQQIRPEDDLLAGLFLSTFAEEL